MPDAGPAVRDRLRGAARALFLPVGPVALGVGFALTLTITGALVAAQPAARARDWLQWASTDLDNLANHPVAALVASAFVTEDVALAWAGLAVIGFWTAGRTLGTARAALLAAGVHVVATLISEGLLAWRIASGAEPETARSILDLGPSYLVVAALTVAIVGGRRWQRIPAAAAFVVVAPSLFDGLDHADVAAVGHCASIALSAVGAIALRRRRSRVEPEAGYPDG